MQCSKATRQIQLYLDKQLNLEQTRALESHLSSCSACCHEYFLLLEIDQALNEMEMVREPADLTMHIMRRVALSSQQVAVQEQKARPLTSFRPSLPEMLIAVALATITMSGIVLEQPSARAALPIANGHDPLSLLVLSLWQGLVHVNSDTVMFFLWIMGTLLGIWITLAVAGSDMRDQWYKAVMDRLPVW
ncbi:anti-sigma factor family protein [Dictyobacter aurantiacus]|uniref:Putative zinc-finger domain-containing protein n=1 Tax=Dictyobacter aurantiacus TaxID=1936993 RepID=A0A401ZBK0_9CHLR|nr:zf-HC2 domain-containing protein [Dictyobacter aurantiacus]GCE04260.1 hypothetical protein KDAU_15890 [Dictyobacter aurantiacus]